MARRRVREVVGEGIEGHAHHRGHAVSFDVPRHPLDDRGRRDVLERVRPERVPELSHRHRSTDPAPGHVAHREVGDPVGPADDVVPVAAGVRPGHAGAVVRRKPDPVDVGKLVGKQALLEEDGHIVLLFVTANADERLGCLIRVRSQEREVGAAHRVLRPENESCGTLDRPGLIDERHAVQGSSTDDGHPERSESRVEALMGLEHEGSFRPYRRSPVRLRSRSDRRGARRIRNPRATVTLWPCDSAPSSMTTSADEAGNSVASAVARLRRRPSTLVAAFSARVSSAQPLTLARCRRRSRRARRTAHQIRPRMTANAAARRIVSITKGTPRICEDRRRRLVDDRHPGRCCRRRIGDHMTP